MTFWRRLVIVSILLLGATFLSFVYTLFTVMERDKDPDFSGALPVLKLSLNDVTLDEIQNGDKEIKYEGNELEVVNNGEVMELSNVQIKGRGNSTWYRDKKPFQIKFKTKVDLFGLGERKKYILLANYLDHSFLRNDAMFKIAEMVGGDYPPTGKFVELYIDKEYQGLYLLATKVEIGKNGVDIRDEYAGLFELDTLHTDNEDCHFSNAGECLILKDAVFEDDAEKSEKVMATFVDDFNRLERYAKAGNFEKVKRVIDVQSFAEYFLVSEFAVNPDAYVSSFNFYKLSLTDKIHAGPFWDYDLAFANREWVWFSDENFYSPTETMVWRNTVFSDENKYSDIGKLMYYLIDIPEFEMEVRRVFQEKLSGRKHDLESHILKQRDYIREAALKDEKKWYEQELFANEASYLIEWISRRYDYMESVYGNGAEYSVDMI